MKFPGTSLHMRAVSRLGPRLIWGTVMFPMLVLAFLAACGGSEAKPAPDFSVTRFDGTEFRLADLVGEKAVVVNFWYPSCPPCRAEMPAFEKAWHEVRDEGVEFLGIFVPQGFDSEQDARDFVDELGLTYGFATDLGAWIARSYKLIAFPTTFFIDQSGSIFETKVSALDEDQIVRTVRRMTQS